MVKLENIKIDDELLWKIKYNIKRRTVKCVSIKMKKSSDSKSRLT
jgi:hypothetical protein